MGTFMTTYDMGAVSMSLPQIMVSFKASLALTSWVILAQLLTATALLLPAGRLGDIVGRKKVYNLGFLIFITGSFLSGMSQSLPHLIIFRVLQASGASMLQTNSFAIVTAVFPERERAKGMGYSSTMAALGTTMGPALGGIVLAATGWRGVFFVNVPVGIVGALAAHLILEEKRVSTPHDKVIRAFDFRGAFLATTAIGSLLAGISLGQERSWGAPETRIFLVIAFLALVAFPFVESRRLHPLVDTQLLKNRGFAFNNASRCIMFLAMAGNVLLMPFYLQIVLGYSPLKTGLLIAPTSLAMAAAAPVSGMLTNRISTRVLSAIGMGAMCIGLFTTTQLDVYSNYNDVLWRLIVIGLGYGFFQTPNNTSIMDCVTRDKFGISSGIMAVGREIGRSVGTSMASAIVVASMAATVGPVSLYSLRREGASEIQGPVLQAFSSAITKAFLVAALLCIPGMVFTLLRGKTPRDKGELTGQTDHKG